MRFFKNLPHFDFLRWRWHAVALSWVIIIAGLVVIWTKGLPKGIEFAGGTVGDRAVRPACLGRGRSQRAESELCRAAAQNAIVQEYGDPSQRQVMVRVPQVGAESGSSLGTTAKAVEDALRKGGLPSFKVVGTEIVGPAVGEELTQKGTSAMVLSLLGLLAYIGFRFQFSFAVGAVIATIHDLLVTLAFLAFFQYDMSLNVIAAILTVTGYSTNDTIVIFDRVRENMRSMRRESLNTVINASINQTLGRTIITGGLTLVSAVALFLFGGEVLRGFLVHDDGRRHHRNLFERVRGGGDRDLLEPRARAGRGRAPTRRLLPPRSRTPPRRSKSQRKAKAS